MSDRTSINKPSSRALGTQSLNPKESTSNASSDTSKKPAIPDIVVGKYESDMKLTEQGMKMPEEKDEKKKEEQRRARLCLPENKAPERDEIMYVGKPDDY